LILQDKFLVCSDCGNRFIYSAADQQFFRSQGFDSDPKRCPPCRERLSNGLLPLVPPGSSEIRHEPANSQKEEVAVVSFDSFGLSPKIMDGIRLSGYVTPTPIQCQSIPPTLEGKDIIGLAQTGTGKTAAFALPMLQRLDSHRRGNIRGLVISPTRELAEQTNESLSSLGRRTGIRVLSLYGGVGMTPQIRNLRDGVDIVVACPGRLLDHVWQGTIDLSSVEMLVIDEADRMFDMGFLPDITNILRCLPQQKQVLLFSATMPEDVRKLVQAYLTEPVTIQIGHSAPASSVTHSFYPVKQHLKGALLIDLLHQIKTDSVVVFTRTKHRTEKVTEKLKQAGFKVTSLQGNLTQSRRQAAIDSFRSGKVKILVATDIASRGIDVLRISHVVNYDMPDTTDAYIHRIGRTGRVDNTGEAFTFISREDSDMVNAVERVLGYKVERRLQPGFDYDAAAPRDENDAYPVQKRLGKRRSVSPTTDEPSITRRPAGLSPQAKPNRQGFRSRRFVKKPLI